MAKSRRRRVRLRKAPIFVLASIILLTVILIVVNANKYNKVINKNLTVEAGKQSISIDDFIIDKETKAKISPITDLSSVKLSEPGKYPVEIKVNKSTLKCEVRVVDTIAPTATPNELNVLKGGSAKAEEFVKDIKDATEVTVILKTKPDFSKAGKQDITVVLTDTSDNSTEIIVPLNIVEDTTPPEITGVKNLTAYVGGTINYRKNVTVTDDYDQNPKLTVDSNDVDISKEGKYTVTYTATDFAGNFKTKTATVTVSKKVSSNDDKKVAAVELADKVIATIIKDDMSVKQKVKAIYNWARGNIGYSGHSDKSDYKVEAYNALKNRSGDCFSYYAVTKLMFERLKIPNIDVVKVKNNAKDSSHFWSLVSVDGGKNYYHFDATPRKGEGDDFCLVTDAFLDAYSDSHNKCHNRDKSRYPKTPTEELG